LDTGASGVSEPEALAKNSEAHLECAALFSIERLSHAWRRFCSVGIPKGNGNATSAAPRVAECETGLAFRAASLFAFEGLSPTLRKRRHAGDSR